MDNTGLGDAQKSALSGNVTETVIDHQVPIVITFLPLGLGIILVTILGIIGNVLSVLVLLRRRLQSSYSVLTIGLSVVDTIYLLTKLVRYGVDSFFRYFSIAVYYTDVFVPIVGPYLRPITFSEAICTVFGDCHAFTYRISSWESYTASTYFTIAIALDRYTAVCWPLKARYFCTRNKARYTATIVLLFSILYNLPRWWEFHTETSVTRKLVNRRYRNITKYSMEISELRKDPDYKLYYIFWAYFIVMFAIPFTSLTFFNFRIWKGIRRSVDNGVILTSVQRRDNSFAWMLTGVVVVFLICNLDYLVLDLMEYFEQPYSKFWNELGNFTLTLNSAINFIIYCVCGWKFREELHKMWKQMNICRGGKIGSHVIHFSVEDEKDSYYTQNFNMQTQGGTNLNNTFNTTKSAPI